ncbi:MAG: KpsF/GutQ family sugar-phosphate isomerase [Pirellulales bacterium]
MEAVRHEAGERRSGAAARELGREILRAEAAAVLALAERLDDRFTDAITLLLNCPGSVMVTGIGKAGLIGQKIAATLASTGTRSHFLHAAEALHGDLGRVHPADVVMVLSYSGETAEITRLLPSLRELGTPIIALTGQPASQLGKAATITLDIGPIQEACALGLAPSTSTTAMLALGDALALTVSHQRRFGPADFARFHPGGSLGRKLARVDDIMRPLAECRVARDADTVRQVFIQLSRPGRRSGAIMLVNATGELSGVFTDSDLARLLEHKRDTAIDGPIAAVMTRRPIVVTQGTAVSAALTTLAGRKISELPVVDDQGRPAGLIDITDLLALLPRSPAASSLAEAVSSSAGPSAVTVHRDDSASDDSIDDTSDDENEHDGPRVVPFRPARRGDQRTGSGQHES